MTGFSLREGRERQETAVCHASTPAHRPAGSRCSRAARIVRRSKNAIRFGGAYILSDVVSRMNESVRRGYRWVIALGVTLAVAWAVFFTEDIVNTWAQRPLRAAGLVLVPAVVIGMLVARARRQYRHRFTAVGVQSMTSVDLEFAWTEVVRVDLDHRAVVLHLQDGRRHVVDLYVVNDANLVREGVLSLVPVAALRGPREAPRRSR